MGLIGRLLLPKRTVEKASAIAKQTLRDCFAIVLKSAILVLTWSTSVGHTDEPAEHDSAHGQEDHRYPCLWQSLVDLGEPPSMA
jgi:hypothetical protein